MEYIPTFVLPAFVLLLCLTKSFSSDPFLIIIPYKSRVNILPYLQRAFHLDDAEDVLCALSSSLLILGRGEQAINPFTCTTGGAD